MLQDKSPFPTPARWNRRHTLPGVQKSADVSAMRTIDCHGCQAQRDENDNDGLLVTCELCRRLSHRACMEKLAAIPEDFDEFMDEVWGCPICLDESSTQWNDIL